MTPRLTYLVPVHDEEPTLREKVVVLAAGLRAHPGARIVLVENGSRDGSRALCERLATEITDVPVLARSVPDAGLGHAFHHGVREATRDAREPGHVLVLTAADLPFGFSDLRAFLEWYPSTTPPLLAIGSKAHPRSLVSPTLQRRLMSVGFLAARRALLGMRTRDPQGSIFVSADLAAALEPAVGSTDFFFSTELVYLAERRGVPVTELPVEYPGGGRRSTVKPVRDTCRMLRQLVALRARTHGARA